MGNVEQGPPADLSSRCRACRLPREGAPSGNYIPRLTAYPLLTALRSAMVLPPLLRLQPEHGSHLASDGVPVVGTSRSDPLLKEPGTLPGDARFPGKLHAANALTGYVVT